MGAIWGGEVAVGSESTFEIGVYTPEGAMTRVVRVLSRVEEVGEDDVETYIQERLAGATLEERPRIRQSLEEMPVPETKPAYGSIMADEVGNLWVGAWAVYPQVPATWTVMDAEGRWLGDVEMPEGFFPLDIGAGWILGVERDAMDVEYIVLYPLRKGRGEGEAR